MIVTNIIEIWKIGAFDDTQFHINRSTVLLDKSIFVLSVAHKDVQLKVGSPYNSNKIGC